MCIEMKASLLRAHRYAGSGKTNRERWIRELRKRKCPARTFYMRPTMPK